MGSEVWRGGDEDACFDDFGDKFEVADGGFKICECVDGTLAGAIGCEFLADLGWDDSGGDEGAVFDGDLS